jgi:hypothetical protein
MTKRILIISLAFLICQEVFSQETDITIRKTTCEIKFNFAPTLNMFFPEINCELINVNNIGFGLGTGVSLRDYDEFQEKFRIMPYIRSYFGNNPKFSFFFEANVILSGLKKYDFYVQDDIGYYHPRNALDSGFGFAYGGKLKISSDFIVEAFLGWGFYFTEKYYPRIGVSFGKQF